ncbi:MAG: four helix bundle protein [Planctomycetota bacterium]
MTIKSHRDLVAWQKALELSFAVYRETEAFPADERFGLISQSRRCAVSVPSNIAEGYGRGSTRDYLRFLRTARGSLYELDTQFLIANGLGLVQERRHQRLQQRIDEVGRLLSGLIRSIERTEQ